MGLRRNPLWRVTASGTLDALASSAGPRVLKLMHSVAAQQQAAN
jgi:hypothetical protein